MSETIIFDVSYVKDIYFDMKIDNDKDSYVLRSMTSQIIIYDVQWIGTTKIIISDYPNVKDNNIHYWNLVDVKDNYFIRFVPGKINIYDIPNSSTLKNDWCGRTSKIIISVFIFKIYFKNI